MANPLRYPRCDFSIRCADCQEQLRFCFVWFMKLGQLPCSIMKDHMSIISGMEIGRNGMKVKIKAVFFDIDGTFFDHCRGCVLPESLKAVKQLKQNGFKVALCSGRPKEMAEQLGVLQMFEWDGYIGGAGTSIYDETGKLIHESYFTEEQCQQLFDLGKQYQVCIHSHGKYDFMTMPINDYSLKVFQDFHFRAAAVREWRHEPLTSLSAYERKDYDWSPFEAVEGLELQHPCDTCVDFLQTDVNKATGIRILMKHWGFAPNEYMAFGDSQNDKEMLQEAACGIAMGSGSEMLKSYADRVIGTASEPTIYQTLKEMDMIQD